MTTSRANVGVAAGERSGGARERVLEAAYELFSRRGIRAVGVDAVVAASGVAKMSLYRHFASKDDLVVAFLGRREELWTRAWLQAEVERRASSPSDRLLAIFDVFDEWFRTEKFEGCSFINVLLEIEDRGHPAHIAAVGHLATIRQFLRELADGAGVANPDDFCRQWHMLMKGSIVAAGEGDREAARRAKDVAGLLLAHELGAARTPQRAARSASGLAGSHGI